MIVQSEMSARAEWVECNSTAANMSECGCVSPVWVDGDEIGLRKHACLWARCVVGLHGVVIALDCANMAGSAHPLVAVLCVSPVLLSLCVSCAGESVAR